MSIELNFHNELSIDLEQGAKLVGNKIAFAKELIQLLVKNLPQDIIDIQQAFTTLNFPQLQSLIHKLHGATKYCGTPRLRIILAAFENALKQNQNDKFAELFAAFMMEAKHLIQEAAEMGVST